MADIKPGYSKELVFFKSLLDNFNIHYQEFDSNASSLSGFDYELRESLGLQAQYEELRLFWQKYANHNRIYKITDSFFCTYYFFLLPETNTRTGFIVGPIIDSEVEKGQILSSLEKFSFTPQDHECIDHFYSITPQLSDDSFLLTLLNTMGEYLWGSTENFTFRLKETLLEELPVQQKGNTATGNQEQRLTSIYALEKRYEFEKSILTAVSQGLSHKAESLISSVSLKNLQQRTVDTLRSVKNYLIVSNTLLRKAAENGGVHPYHIDKISSVYATKIEQLNSADAGNRLHYEMVRKYSLLVKNHSIGKFSPMIQKVITLIDSDLTMDLGLQAIADTLRVNPSYLSSSFKKETGSTLTDYVNRKRIDHALLLLNSTTMQVQSIAQHCGILDVNYFTKLFKKYIGITPKEYRNGITN